MIRSFIGVQIAPEVRARIVEATAQLAQHIPGIRWVPEENFHFTLKFLGDIEQSRIEPICEALAEAFRPFRRFTINAKRLGVFPDLKRARVIWVGVEGNNLPALANRVEIVLEAFGYPRDNRIFQPHLTVGRWRTLNGSPKGLGTKLDRWSSFEFGQSVVDEVVLFESVLQSTGAVYRRLRALRLDDD